MLTPEQAALVQQRLDEAEAALHALLTGQAKVSVRSAAGHQVAYQPGDAAALQGYIAGLKRQLGIAHPGRIRTGA